jgi:hypothetical protein
MDTEGIGESLDLPGLMGKMLSPLLFWMKVPARSARNTVRLASVADHCGCLLFKGTVQRSEDVGIHVQEGYEAAW